MAKIDDVSVVIAVGLLIIVGLVAVAAILWAVDLIGQQLR